MSDESDSEDCWVIEAILFLLCLAAFVWWVAFWDFKADPQQIAEIRELKRVLPELTPLIQEAAKDDVITSTEYCKIKRVAEASIQTRMVKELK